MYKDWDDFFIASDEDTVLQFLKIQESGKAGEDQESQVMKSPVPLDECAFDEEAEQGKKSVNGHVNGHNEAGDEENESPESPVIDASEGKDAADVDEMRVEGGDKSPAVTPSLSPLPADNEELAEEQADDDGEILPHSVDEASKLGNREDDGQDVEGNEVEE